MHALTRNAGFSLLALSASCGVGVQAQGLDTRIAKDFQNTWVQTLPGKPWFSYLRLSAPTQAYLDKSWKPDDITPAL